MNNRNQNIPKHLSNVRIKQLGLDPNNFLSFSDTLEDLEKRVPNIVIGEATTNFAFVQNKTDLNELKKKTKYVMSLTIFGKLQYDTRLNKKLLKPSVPFSRVYKKYRGDDLNNKTLLVWRTGGIGDILFIQPNLIYLKEKYPECKILFACGPQYKPLVNNWSCIDEVVNLPFDFKRLIQTDYHAIFEGVIERCKEAENINAYNLFSKWLNLNLDNDKLVPKLEPKDNLVKESENILLNEFNIDLYNEKIILFQRRASSIVRSLNYNKSAEIINSLVDNGYRVILTDSPTQSEDIRNFIKNKIDNPERVFNFAKYSKSIDYTIALASIVNCCISVDSSLIHIAQGVGTPTLGLYGPFPGKIRMETYKNSDWIDCESSCSPCYLHGHRPCKNSDIGGFSKCFNNLDINEVVNKVNRMING